MASKTRAGSAAASVEDHESLEAGAVVRQLAKTIQDKVDNLLADGIVPTSEVVSRVLLTRNQLLRVEKLTVGARADLVNDGRLQVDEDAAGNVLSSTGLGEEGVKRIVS